MAIWRNRDPNETVREPSHPARCIRSLRAYPSIAFGPYLAESTSQDLTLEDPPHVAEGPAEGTVQRSERGTDDDDEPGWHVASRE